MPQLGSALEDRGAQWLRSLGQRAGSGLSPQRCRPG